MDAAKPKTRRRWRPWWQIAIRTTVFAVMFLIAAYISLPWWAPTGLLRRQLAADLAEQTGAPVQIDRLSLSWREGVTLLGLQIDSPDGFDEGPMLRVERIQADLAPLRYLLTKRISWMEIERPVLIAQVNDAWETNVTALQGLMSAAQAQRISVNRATGVLVLPGQARQQMDVGHMQFEAGHLASIGHVSVAGSLQQDEQDAPISLQVDGGRPGDPVAVRADVQFTDVRLGQLPLARFLPAAIEQLDGRCSGSAHVQVNRRGQADQIGLDLVIQDLLVDPADMDPMPTVPTAALHVDAAFDPLLGPGHLVVRELTVKLPDAVDLTGQMTLFAGALAGDWQSVQGIHLEGEVDPSRLAAMLRGQGELAPAGLSVDGAVTFSFDVDHAGATLNLQLEARAPEAVIVRNGHTLKPAGRDLAMGLALSLDSRTWACQVDQATLSLGNNSLGGAGTVADLSRLLSRWKDPQRATSLAKDLQGLQWQWQGRLADLPALAQLFPDHAGALAKVSLDGYLTASGSLGQTGPGSLEVLVDVPGQTKLSVGSALVKHPPKAISFRLAALAGDNGVALENIDMDLTTGAGRLRWDQGALSVSKQGTARANGRFEITRLEDFLACIPSLADRPDLLGGSLQGSWQALVKNGAADVDADLSHISLTPVDKTQTDLASLTGSIETHLQLERAGPQTTVQFDIDATELDLRTGLEDGPRKTAGLPLRLRGQAAVAHSADVDARVEQLSLELAGSAVTVRDMDLHRSGRAVGTFEAVISPDDGLSSLWPEAARLVAEHGLSGQAHLTGDFSVSDTHVQVAADIDAGKIALDSPLGFIKPPERPLQARVAGQFDRADSLLTVTVDEGWLDQINFSAAATCDVQARRARGRFGARTDHAQSLLSFWANAPIGLAGGGAALSADWEADRQDIAIAGGLTAADLLVPFKGKNVRLKGLASFVASLQPGENMLELSALALDGFEFEVGQSRGWLVVNLAAEPIDLNTLLALATTQPAGPQPLPAARLTGDVHLIAESIDTQELSQWLGNAPATPTTQPSPRPAYRKLTDDQRADLYAQGERIIEQIRPPLLGSNIDLRATISCLHSYDPVIGNNLDLNDMHLTGGVDQGQVHFEYAGGLKGGTIRRSYDIDFNDETPLMVHQTRIRNVRADDDIRPLVSYTFPGNTVLGFFNHEEDFTTGLAHILANSLDPFYELHSIGTSKTVTITGTAEGQAAPKFITRVFPGLNTAAYHYQEMTSFGIHGPDDVENDTIFNGAIYDTYMLGKTRRDHIGRYELGVILLNAPQSPEWNHAYRQGRVPILKFKARIEHGELHDVSLSYPWPNQSLYTMFLKNNYFYRVWVERQRTKGLEPLPSSETPVPQTEEP